MFLDSTKSPCLHFRYSQPSWWRLWRQKSAAIELASTFQTHCDATARTQGDCESHVVHRRIQECWRDWKKNCWAFRFVKVSALNCWSFCAFMKLLLFECEILYQLKPSSLSPANFSPRNVTTIGVSVNSKLSSALVENLWTSRDHHRKSFCFKKRWKSLCNRWSRMWCQSWR